MTVAYAGSTGLMNLRLATRLDREIAKLPERSTILLRRGRESGPGVFETVVSGLANHYGVVVRWMAPEGTGRAATYERDYTMVEAADRVEAYFSSDRVMEGGTAHVVEAAMARNVPVYAWSLEPDGSITRVGELEREN